MDWGVAGGGVVAGRPGRGGRGEEREGKGEGEEREDNERAASSFFRLRLLSSTSRTASAATVPPIECPTTATEPAGKDLSFCSSSTSLSIFSKKSLACSTWPSRHRGFLAFLLPSLPFTSAVEVSCPWKDRATTSVVPPSSSERASAKGE